MLRRDVGAGEYASMKQSALAEVAVKENCRLKGGGAAEASRSWAIFMPAFTDYREQ